MFVQQLCWKSNKHYLFWLCVSSFYESNKRGACNIFSCVVCPTVPYFSTLSDNGTIFEKKLLTYSMEFTPSPYPQVPATCPYPEPTPSSPHDPLQLPEDLS